MAALMKAQNAKMPQGRRKYSQLVAKGLFLFSMAKESLLCTAFLRHICDNLHNSTRTEVTCLLPPHPRVTTTLRVIFRSQREAVRIHWRLVAAPGTLPEPLYAPSPPTLEMLTLSEFPLASRFRKGPLADESLLDWEVMSSPPGMAHSRWLRRVQSASWPQGGDIQRRGLCSRIPRGSGQGWVSWDPQTDSPLPSPACPRLPQASPNSIPSLLPGIRLTVSGSAAQT